MINIFTTNYHNGVNYNMVRDFVSVSNTVYMPIDNWKKIWFYAPNDEHRDVAKLVAYEEFISLPPMAIVIPCNQLIDPFMQFYRDRGQVDVLVYLTAQSISAFPDDGSDFILTHDIEYHRRTEAKYKMIYFCKPRLYLPQIKDLKTSYESKQINLFVNNFRGPGFEPEYADAKLFREAYMRHIPFYGYDNEDGMLSEVEVQERMLNAAFTLVFKRRETWGQTTNVSMLYGTPLIMLRKYMNNLLTQYEITEDNSILGDSVEELIDKINTMTFEQYETMSWQARTMAEMFCADRPRRNHLSWLFSKVEEELGKKNEY